MFGPWIEIFGFVRGLVPSDIRRPNLSFITLHYLYLLSLTIIASVVLYAGSNMAYIDSLFFGSGAATQSGLNTININELLLYQQIVLMLIACIANPIFIHTFVVFIRLYWFEKRFQNIVLDSQRLRRTRTRERSRTKTDEKLDLNSDLEKGNVSNRRPVTPHMKSTNDGQSDDDEENSNNRTSSGRLDGIQEEQENEESPGSGGEQASSDDNHGAPSYREITFADEVEQPKTSGADTHGVPAPAPMTTEQHIAFFENQKNPKDKDVLYIPGPRDFDRGDLPQKLIEDEESLSLQRAKTVETFPSLDENAARTRENTEELNEDDHPERSSSSDQEIAKVAEGPSRSGSVISKLKQTLPTKLVRIDDDDRDTGKGFPSPGGLRRRDRTRTFASFLSTGGDEERDPMPYLSYQPTMGRNSKFVNLTEEQREELGGIEYRALKLLAAVLSCYYVGFHLFAMLCFLPWIVRSGTYSSIVREDGINPIWWGFFTAASHLNDLGFTLTPDSMIHFYNATFILLMGSFFIVIGNTGFPCMLRFVIWILAKLSRHGSAAWEELHFLLDHPRRCFTLLFPTNATWWLFWVLVGLNALDLIFFIILNLHNPTVTHIPVSMRVLDGWYQASSTRTAGFAVHSLSDLHPAIQVSYLIMMYISVFPIAISVRRTNVYEEKSLGVYEGSSEDDTDDTTSSSPRSYVGNHLRRQLSFDLWYIFLGLFFIAIIEGDRLEFDHDYYFTMFSVLFEVISAYGTVGLSLGYPGTDASLCGQFRTLSKLIIIAMQIRGRHRGLPYALDKAILLPGEGKRKREEEEAARRAEQNATATATDVDVSDQAGASGAEGAEAGLPRQRTHTSGLQKSGTAQSEGTVRSGATRTSTGRSTGGGLTRLISQALSAGPTMTKQD
ncbi:MAG: low affinity potassium transporter [Alyxoria varia]|nr:MAG: low affinity potassium transporter [Alyxoria varia]